MNAEWYDATKVLPSSEDVVLVTVRGSDKIIAARYDQAYKAWHPTVEVTMWTDMPPIPIEQAMALQLDGGDECDILRDAVMKLPIYAIRKVSKTCQKCGHPNMTPVHETLLAVWMEDGVPIDGPLIRDAEGTQWRVVRTPSGLRRRVEL